MVKRANLTEIIGEVLEANAAQLNEWLNLIDDPAKKVDLYLKALEFKVPKLGRTELAGSGGGALEFVIRDLAKEG